MATWPAAFGNPETGVSLNITPPVTSTQMDGGDIRIRKDRRGKREVFTASFVVYGIRLAMFRTWHFYKVAQGNDFFDMPVLTDGGGVVTKSVRFLDGDFSVSLQYMVYGWTVTVQMETFS